MLNKIKNWLKKISWNKKVEKNIKEGQKDNGEKE